MSERALQGLTRAMEGIDEGNPLEREAEMQAWHAAVLLLDYTGMHRAGSVLRTNIHGTPYQSNLDAMRDCGLSDQAAELFTELSLSGLQKIVFQKPKLTDIIPEFDQYEHEDASLINHLRKVHSEHFLKMAFEWGFRDIMAMGVKGYLDRVPNRIKMIAFCAPDATKSFITSEGYVATGHALEPDHERPLSQRGGGPNGFLRSEYGHENSVFQALVKQLRFLEANRDRFLFDASDLLGYRPHDLNEEGIAQAWSGWDAD